jgi:ribosome-associated protein
VRPITIRDDSIRLGQFLKLAGMADSGSDAKLLLETGQVQVNGAPEIRRGRQLHPGDEVSVPGDSARVVRHESLGL